MSRQIPDQLVAALEAVANGSATRDQESTVIAALRSGSISIAKGESAVAIGGDASGAQIVTAEGGRILNLTISGEEALSALSRLLRPSSAHALPPDLSDFAGRQEEVETLVAQLSGDRGSAAISALDGLGGIGKTALAVHVAHQLADAFPAGRLLFELAGTSEAPTPPAKIMARLIQAVHPTAQLPADEQAITALYRDVLSRNRLLLILDNARDAAQASPLLPPAPSRAIITSRQPIVLPNVKAHRLGILRPEQARDLLGELVPSERASDDELDRIAKACGYLPLALRVAGTFLRLHRAWSIAEYLSELENERTRLQVLQVADHDLDVAKTLGLSIAQLAKEDPALVSSWRTLSVFPGDFDREAVAAVWGCSEVEARDGLDTLIHRTLTVYDSERQRFSLHDLMRDMTLREAEARTVAPKLAQAARRHAHHYHAVLAAAGERFLRGNDQVAVGLALYDLERHNIERGHAWAVENLAQDTEAARLSCGYTDAGAHVLSLRQHPREAIAWLEAGVAGARAVGDRRGEGNALGNLGAARARLGDARKAIELYERQLQITREIGDRRGEGNALGGLGLASFRLGEVRRAIELHEKRSVIAREIGDRRGLGNALGHLGLAWAELGEVRKAIELYEQALVISRKIGDRRAEGHHLGDLGVAWARLGEVRKAIELHGQALVISRDIGHRRGEGDALGGLGLAWADLGEVRKAIELHQQALVISREIGDRLGEGNARFNLAVAHKRLNEDEDAVRRAQEALEVLVAIESPHVERVQKALEDWRLSAEESHD